MIRLKVLAIKTLLLLVLEVALFGGGGNAQQRSDVENVKATLDEFHTAQSMLDIRKMEELWAHDAYVMYIGPRDKTITVGWDAVKKKWDATLGFWTELKVTTNDAPHLHVNGSIAWADSIANVVGTPKNGPPVNGPTFESIVLEKRGDRWLIVSDSTSRMPQ
jgi:ketosteroid isomerase-like protein